MNQPLGVAIGNWLEVIESVDCLRGKIGNDDTSSDLMEVTLVLSAAMVYLGKKVGTIKEGIEKCRKMILDGSAYKKFLELVHAQGGNTKAIENLERSGQSKFAIEIKANDVGYINDIDSYELGMTSIFLGAGRQKIDDIIDMKAGILLKKKIGDKVKKGDTLAIFYTDRESVIDSARDRIGKAFRISTPKPEIKPMIFKIVDKNGVRKW
jgi:pyrimidine-nucleoside phosphorylase